VRGSGVVTPVFAVLVRRVAVRLRVVLMPRVVAVLNLSAQVVLMPSWPRF